MKKIKYVLLFIICFMYIGIVKADTISIDAIQEELKSEGYTVTNAGGKLTVSKNGEVTEYTINESSNTLSYTDTNSSNAQTAAGSSTILKVIVKLSSNYANYQALKESNSSVVVNYGTGCSLTNMGFCFDSSTKKMEVSLSNTFTTYLVNQYGGGSSALPGESAAASLDPNAQNPATGSFAEYGVVFGLIALLLVVIILKKRNETEYDL